MTLDRRSKGLIEAARAEEAPADAGVEIVLDAVPFAGRTTGTGGAGLC
jgi:hypothetical protein